MLESRRNETIGVQHESARSERDVPMEPKLCEGCNRNFFRKAVGDVKKRAKRCRKCFSNPDPEHQPKLLDWRNSA